MNSETLSYTLLQSLQRGANAALPPPDVFGLPEKVLQFGTGVLLRGLPDFFIDKANRQGIFNGRVVVVKSTDAGGTDAFSRQDGLYTLCQRGIGTGESRAMVEEISVNAAISRVLSARRQWRDILRCAHNPDLQVIISNTTEVGIQPSHDRLTEAPPPSFPGKLTAFLYERFRAFNGSPSSGMVIVPCELLVDNGSKLREIVMELARQNGLETEFIQWLQTANTFCNSLVDRIVTGMPAPEVAEALYARLGYRDELLTVSELYRLWAIEGDERVKQILSFERADEGIFIVPDIAAFRERKLRLLNGTHTLMVGLGYLYGLHTVGECMNEPRMHRFVTHLIREEIAPAVPVDRESALHFAGEVLNRFANPDIAHYLLNITVQYTSKMRMRNVQTLLNHYREHHFPPRHITLGFAAYLLFMRATTREEGVYYGQRNGERYRIQDDWAPRLHECWAAVQEPTEASVRALVVSVTADPELWGENLDALPGFTDAVAGYVYQMLTEGVPATLRQLEATVPQNT